MKVWPESKVHLAQADAGSVRKIHPGEQKLAEAAKDLEERYSSGQINAEEVLKEAALQVTNRQFREKLQEAAAEDAEGGDDDDGHEPVVGDPVLQISEDMMSSDEGEEEGEPAIDFEQDEEEAEMAERAHEWQAVDWPETVRTHQTPTLPPDRVLAGENVNNVVQSVCTVCMLHYDFHVLFHNCTHHVCRTCFAQLDRCPICRQPRGPLRSAKTISNNPSLIRADADGRAENENFAPGDNVKQLFILIVHSQINNK